MSLEGRDSQSPFQGSVYIDIYIYVCIYIRCVLIGGVARSTCRRSPPQIIQARRCDVVRGHSTRYCCSPAPVRQRRPLGPADSRQWINEGVLKGNTEYFVSLAWKMRRRSEVAKRKSCGHPAGSSNYDTCHAGEMHIATCIPEGRSGLARRVRAGRAESCRSKKCYAM